MIPNVLLPQPLDASEKLNAGVVCTVDQYADSVVDTSGTFYALVIYDRLTLSENWPQGSGSIYDWKKCNIFCRGGQSSNEFCYALFRNVAKQGKWETPSFFGRYQTVSTLALAHQEYRKADLTSVMRY